MEFRCKAGERCFDWVKLQLGWRKQAAALRDNYLIKSEEPRLDLRIIPIVAVYTVHYHILTLRHTAQAQAQAQA